MNVISLPYFKDSSEAYGHLAERRGFVFLDSGFPHTQAGHYDILSADPVIQLHTHDELTHCQRDDQEWQTHDDPFDVLKRYLGEPISVDEALWPSLPFYGGALGFFSYDLGRRVEEMPNQAIDDVSLPQMAMGIYNWAIVVDHKASASWLVVQGAEAETETWLPTLLESLQEAKAKTITTPFSVTSEVTSNLDQAGYAKAFDRIKHYINEGDCYQVNLTQRFSADVKGDAWDAYCRLRKQNPAPFAGFMKVGESAILSSSPERFLEIRQGQVETKPIKGTRPRDDDPQKDQALAEELRESSKDQAENVMIVDLLRNDIGKNCAIGSVSVPKLFAIESYKTVHHLVSTVTGKLDPEHHVIDLLRGAFPGGSITGAPKLRSMEIIEELEPHRRSVYCGSMGYISFDGQTDTNIAIRTMIWDDGKIYASAGGGIVMDSQMEAEYQETFDKAAAMLKVLENARSA